MEIGDELSELVSEVIVEVLTQKSTINKIAKMVSKAMTERNKEVNKRKEVKVVEERIIFATNETKIPRWMNTNEISSALNVSGINSYSLGRYLSTLGLETKRVSGLRCYKIDEILSDEDRIEKKVVLGEKSEVIEETTTLPIPKNSHPDFEGRTIYPCEEKDKTGFLLSALEIKKYTRTDDSDTLISDLLFVNKAISKESKKGVKYFIKKLFTVDGEKVYVDEGSIKKIKKK